jgi:hypothetical protein
MPDLFTLLTARFVEEHSAGASPLISDTALQWMELELEASRETGADERYLLEQYLSLRNDELQSLPVPVHEWFLQRWAMTGSGTDDVRRSSQLADRIAVMYLIMGPGIHQAAVIAALLAFDHQGNLETSNVTRIWDLVIERVPIEAQPSALTPLIEALLDLIYLTPQPEEVLRALSDIARRDAQNQYVVPLIKERVEFVREGSDGGLLTRLLTNLRS